MRDFRYIIGLGALLLSAVLSTSSCTDGNDWEADSAYARLFGTKTSSFTVTPAEDIAQAEVSWQGTPETKNYIIEISTALLTDEVEPGTSEGSIFFGNGDEQITKTAYTLKELSPNTEYYARIKSVNGDKESDWVYLEDGTFKTCKEEQVLVTPSTDNGDIEEKSIRISWQPCKVDRIRIYTEDASYDETIELSEADIAFGSCIISGLTQGTRYTVEIYNGETMRGSIEVMTGEGEMLPITIGNVQTNSATLDWNYVGNVRANAYTLVEGTEYSTANPISFDGNSGLMLNSLNDYTTYTFALLNGTAVMGYKTFTTKRAIPAGYAVIEIGSEDDFITEVTKSITRNTVFKLASNADFTLKKMKDNGSGVDDIKIPSTSGINVIVWGEESDDSKAVLRLASALGIKGSFHTIELFNLEITTTVENANGRIFNIQDDSNTFTEMKIEACDILDGQVLFRVKHGEGKPSLGILTISNCIIGNFTKDGSLLNLSEEKSGTLKNINIKNSTIWNMAGKVIYAKNASDRTYTISGCTFYDAPNDGKAFFDDNVNSESTTIKISNTLFGGNQNIDSAIRNKNTVTAENVYSASDFTYGKNGWPASSTVMNIDKTSVELFPNAAAGDFTVAPKDYKKFGDPRWNN